jgi:hypothetical protein
MSEIKLPADSGGGSISIKGPSSSSADVDLLDTTGDLNLKDGKKLKLGDSGDLSIYHDGSHSRLKNDTGYIILNTDTGVLLKNAADDTNYLACDSNGIITQPLKPAFCAKGASSWTNVGTNNSGHVPVLANELFDRNADYNNSTYKFTCPVNGIYYFGFNIYWKLGTQSDTNNGYWYGYLMVANTEQAHAHIMKGYNNQGDADTTTSFSGMHHCDAGNEVYWQLKTPNESEADLSYYGAHTSFFGYLVG